MNEHIIYRQETFVILVEYNKYERVIIDLSLLNNNPMSDNVI